MEVSAPLIALIGTMAADCVARAIMRGVYEAESLGDYPGYRDQRG
jgi:L-aminopeptidase/D-esterase-like protein